MARSSVGVIWCSSKAGSGPLIGLHGSGYGLDGPGIWSFSSWLLFQLYPVTECCLVVYIKCFGGPPICSLQMGETARKVSLRQETIASCCSNPHKARDSLPGGDLQWHMAVQRSHARQPWLGDQVSKAK